MLTIAFPRTACKYIKKAMDEEFLHKHDIIPESVFYGKVCIPRTLGLSIPDLRMSIQEDLDTIAMPDPPQNVMEEVSRVMCTVKEYNVYCLLFHPVVYIHHQAT